MQSCSSNMHLRWFIKVRKLLCKQTQSCEDNKPSELKWISIRGRQRDRLHRRHDGTETFRLLQTVLEVHRASALTGGKLARGRSQTAPRWPSASLVLPRFPCFSTWFTTNLCWSTTPTFTLTGRMPSAGL